MTNPISVSELRFGWETAYASETGTKDKVFGQGMKITTLNRRNNVEPIFGLGARNAQKLPVKQFEGSLSVESVLASPWFFRAVLGAASTTGGSGPYTHTWAESDTLTSMSIENELSTDTKGVVAFLGCVVNTCVITAAINELVRVRLDMLYSTESEDTTTDANVTDSFDLYTFAQATLELPDDSTVTDVQSVELTLNNSIEMLYGLGSRLGQKAPAKNRPYTARITRSFEDAATFLERFYGSGTGPNATVVETSLEVIFSNGLTGTNTRNIILTFGGVVPDEHNLPQDPTAIIMEDVPLIMRSLSVTATNNTELAP